MKRIDGEGWILQDDRIEVPGYKDKKKEQQSPSIDRILEVMNIDVEKTPMKSPSTVLAGSGVARLLARAVNADST